MEEHPSEKVHNDEKFIKKEAEPLSLSWCCLVGKGIQEASDWSQHILRAWDGKGLIGVVREDIEQGVFVPLVTMQAWVSMLAVPFAPRRQATIASATLHVWYTVPPCLVPLLCHSPAPNTPFLISTINLHFKKKKKAGEMVIKNNKTPASWQNMASATTTRSKSVDD